MAVASLSINLFVKISIQDEEDIQLISHQLYLPSLFIALYKIFKIHFYLPLLCGTRSCNFEVLYYIKVTLTATFLLFLMPVINFHRAIKALRPFNFRILKTPFHLRAVFRKHLTSPNIT